MTSIRPGIVLSDSSDSDDLPTFDFLQSQPRADVHVSTGAAKQDIVMVSSDSEEEVVVPLAVRLKQKHGLVGRTEKSQMSDKHPHVLIDRQQINSQPPSLEHHKMASKMLSSHHKPEYHISTDHPLRTEIDSDVPKLKKSQVEVDAARQEAQRIRAEREHQQKEKERQRMEKKAMADAVKAQRPEECIQHMVVTVDPGLLQLEGGGALLTSLHAMGCSCAIEKQPLPRSITWARRTPSSQTGETISIPDSFTIIQVPVDDFVTMINNYCTSQCTTTWTECGISLTRWITGLMKRNPDRTLSVVVIEIERYFKNIKSKSQKKYREAVLGEEKDVGLQGGQKRRRKENNVSQLPEVSRVQVEEALVDLQLNTGVQVHFLSTWKDLTDYITMTTKAVAEAPFKKERENTGFTFCLETEWAGGQKVDRAGNGLLQVWKRQIQQLNRVSTDMAAAILSAYPSPRILSKAYAQCKSEREKVNLLSDILIRRGEGVTSTTRRVGPELSKRLYIMMTSVDEQQTLDSVVHV